MSKLTSERLIFRRYVESDKAQFVDLFTDESVMKYVGDGVLDEEEADAFWHKMHSKLYPQDYNIWGVFTLENRDYVGHAGIYQSQIIKGGWEFVYFLVQNEWYKGYATEIARQLIEFGFGELKLEEVFTTIDNGNLQSIKVAQKSGMKFLRYETDEKGRFSVFSLTNPVIAI